MKSRKIMIRLSQMVLLVLFTSMSFGCMNMPPKEQGPGYYIKQDRPVSNFSSLDIGGAFGVTLIQGSEEKLVIEADEQDMEDIISEVVGNKLKIYTKSGYRGNFRYVSVYLTFKNLDDISFSGAVDVKSQGPLSFEDLQLDVSGAAEIQMDLSAAKLDAEFSGASEVEFNGKCENAYVELSGASEFNAENLQLTNLDLELSGASNADVYATGELSIDASGASSVSYSGGAKLSVNTSGASSVKQR